MASLLKLVGELGKQVHLKPIQDKIPASQSSVAKKTSKVTTTMTASRVDKLMAPGPKQVTLAFGTAKEPTNQ